MPEPRNDMLPDAEATSEIEVDIQSKTEPVRSEPVETPADPAPEVAAEPEPEPEEPMVPLSALKEERQRRKELQEENAVLKAATSPDEPLDEDTAAKVQRLEFEIAKTNLYNVYPTLRDHQEEFETYIEDFVGFPLEKVARTFIAERLPVTKPARKGLEKPTSGTRQAPTQGLSDEDEERIRTTQPRRYAQMAREGKIGNQPW